MVEEASNIKNKPETETLDKRNDVETYRVEIKLTQIDENPKIVKGNICTVIDDLGLYVECKDFLAVSIMSIAFVLLQFFSNNLDSIEGLWTSILPSLLGITIAVYTILFSLDDSICRKLNNIASDEKNPYEVLHATFVFGLIVQCFSLIWGLLMEVIEICIGKTATKSLCWFLLFFSIIWTINMVLHLYTLRTFRIESK